LIKPDCDFVFAISKLSFFFTRFLILFAASKKEGVENLITNEGYFTTLHAVRWFQPNQSAPTNKKKKKETQNKQTNSGKKSEVYTCVGVEIAGCVFLQFGRGKREKGKQKRKGLGLQETSPTVHTHTYLQKKKNRHA